MKPTPYLLPAALLGLSTLAFGQSNAQKSFDQLKSLAGSHTEDWTFLAHGKPINAHLDLQRTK